MGYLRYTPAGHLIRRARRYADLTQAELGNEVGMTQGRISDYERSKLDPIFSTMLRLLAACGLSLRLVPPEESNFVNPELNGRIFEDVLSLVDAIEELNWSEEIDEEFD